MALVTTRTAPFCAALLATLIGICSGCSVPRYVATPDQANGTRKMYQEGLELLVSKKKHSAVTAGLRRLTEKEKHMQLILLVQNRGSEAFNVKPTQIDVLFEQKGTSKVLPIYPPSEAVAKITFDERLTAALNAAAATYNQNTEIDTEANANLAQGNALAAIADGKSVRSTLLRKETLFAGDEVAGAAYFALKDRGRLTIKIPAGQDTHTFYFEAQEN